MSPETVISSGGVSKGDRIEMRLVHIFEFENGKISKETVFDMGRVL